MFSKTWFINNRSWIFFIGVIVLAIVLRFWQLGSIPGGFHADEADFGYNAYSLLQTGKDEYGQSYPLIYRSFGDYKGAVYAYLTIPFIASAGLNEWAVRVPSAIFGMLFIVLTFAFVFRLSGSRSLALLSMALAVISPLGVLLSRVQSDPLVCFVIFYGAVYFWFLWMKKQKYVYLVVFLIGIAVSFYTYAAIRLFAIPFLLFIGAWYWHTFSKRIKIVSIALFITILLASIWLFFSPTSTRFSQISVFSSMNVQLPLDEEIREDGTQNQSILITRIVHNKVTAYGRYLLKNFSDYVSFRFLFLQADQPQREEVPNMGVLLLIECPFLLLGIYTVIRKKSLYGIFSILWFLLVPAVMAVGSDETPNIHRFFLAMIPLHLLVATGILKTVQTVRPSIRSIVIFGIFVLFSLNIVYFTHQLFVHQPVHMPVYRNGADKDLALYLKSAASSYDVIVSQKILEDMLFFWPIEPSVYQKEGSPRDTDNARYRNFLFVPDPCPSLLLNTVVASIKANRVLYVDKSGCKLLEDDVIIDRIRYKNTLDAYYLIEKRTIMNK